MGTSNGRLVNTYDDAGRVLTETSFDAKGVAPWKNTYKYDAEGRRIEWAQYQSDVLRYKVLSKYDDRGRIIEQETLEFNGNPNVRWSHAPVPGKLVYVYDDAKNTREISTFDSDGSLKGKEVRTRDEKGNDIGWAYFDGYGLPKYSDVNWYDKNKVVRTLSGQTTLKFDYDSHGNWIRKTYFVQPASEEPEPYRMETRNITYF